MRTTEYSNRIHAATEALKVQRNALATADILSPASVAAVAEIRRLASSLEVLAIDLASAQRAEADGHRADLEN